MSKKNRRKALKMLAVGAPAVWAKPIVNSVALPAHAGLTQQATAECDETQVSGGNEPVTRTIEMGQNSGNFDFTYQMLGVPDQMIVRYQGGVLHDTGCVNGGTTVPLAFSGASTQIEVEVIPDCASFSSTSWSFTVSCPEET